MIFYGEFDDEAHRLFAKLKNRQSLISNKIGYLRLAESLEWSGQAEFIQQEMKPWTAGTDNHVAGHTKTVRAKNGSGGGVLTWTEIDGAGHMVRTRMLFSPAFFFL